MPAPPMPEGARAALPAEEALVRFAECDPVAAGLKDIVRKRDAEIAELKLARRADGQKRRRWELRCKAARDEVQQLRSLQLRRGDTAKFSAYGGMCLAIRRCTSNSSSRNLGIALELDVHHTTVNRWETKCDAALLGASRGFYAEMQAAAREASDPGVAPLADALLLGAAARAAPDAEAAQSAVVAAGPARDAAQLTLASAAQAMQAAVHLIRSDATNAAVWQRCKLHACEASSAFVPDSAQCASDADAESSVRDAFELNFNKKIADLQVVTDATGEGCFAMICSQVASTGLPLWSTVAAARALAAQSVLPLPPGLAQDLGPGRCVNPARPLRGLRVPEQSPCQSSASKQPQPEARRVVACGLLPFNARALLKPWALGALAAKEGPGGPDSLLHIYCMCTDAGRDQVKARKIIQQQARP